MSPLFPVVLVVLVVLNAQGTEEQPVLKKIAFSCKEYKTVGYVEPLDIYRYSRAVNSKNELFLAVLKQCQSA